MKRMCSWMSMAVVIACLTAVSIAQQPGGGNKQEAVAKLEKISAELQLSPEQKQQMLPILREEVPKIEAVKNNASLGPLQKGMQMKQISADMDAKVKPILNPQQWQKWEAIRAQERQEMMQKMQGGR